MSDIFDKIAFDDERHPYLQSGEPDNRIEKQTAGNLFKYFRDPSHTIPKSSVNALKDALDVNEYDDMFPQYLGPIYRGMIVSTEQLRSFGFDPNGVIIGDMQRTQCTYTTKHGYSSWSSSAGIAKQFSVPEALGGFGKYNGPETEEQLYGIVLTADASKYKGFTLDGWYFAVDGVNSVEQEVFILEKRITVQSITVTWK